MGDRGAARVPHQHDLALDRVQGVDRPDDRIDVVAQRDPRAIGVH
jgi:hypothetical protein